MRTKHLISVFLLIPLGAAALAQTPDTPSRNVGIAPPPEGPICNADTEGQLSCQANRVCECVFSTAVPARRLPDRWRWNCDIKRPQCTVTPDGFTYGDQFVPYGVVVDHDDAEPFDSEQDDTGPPRP